MRPIIHRQNALRAPLNELLATEANVRILRALAEAQRPLNAAELARRTQLGRTSVYPATAALDATGIIDHLRDGTKRVMQLNERHALSAPIRALFDAERARTRALAEGIRSAANGLSPRPVAAWIEGSTDNPANLVRVRVLDRTGRGDEAAERLRHAVAHLERKLGVAIEVSGASRAALERIARRMQRPSPRERLEQAEWDRTLNTKSAAQLGRLLDALAGGTTRRRQTTTMFLGVLPPDERNA